MSKLEIIASMARVHISAEGTVALIIGSTLAIIGILAAGAYVFHLL